MVSFLKKDVVELRDKNRTDFKGLWSKIGRIDAILGKAIEASKTILEPEPPKDKKESPEKPH